jgi:hypothetical protein
MQAAVAPPLIRLEEIIRRRNQRVSQMIHDELERYVGVAPDDPRYWELLRQDGEKWFAVFTILSGFLLKDADLFGIPRASWPEDIERLMRNITVRREEIEADTVAQIKAIVDLEWP